MTAKRDDLEVLAKALLEFETLSGDEIKDLLNGKRPRREFDHRTIDPALLDGADRRQAAVAAGNRRHGAAAAGIIPARMSDATPRFARRFFATVH